MHDDCGASARIWVVTYVIDSEIRLLAGMIQYPPICITIDSMMRLIDETLIFCLCLPLVAWTFQGWGSIVCILVTAIALVSFELAGNRYLRPAIAMMLIVACALLTSFVAFLPLAAYLCMAQRYWAVRYAWIVGWAVALLQPMQLITACALPGCCMAAVLAVRTGRALESTRALRESRDAVKEHLIELLGQPAVVEADDAPEADGEQTAAEGSARMLRFSDLTDRENSVVSLIAEGCENKEIASRLYLSEGTVRNVVSSILQKKQLTNRTQIAIMYYRN